MRRVALTLLMLLAAMGAAVASAAESPSALRARIIAAAKAQSSVHWEQKGIFGRSLVSYVTDSGTTEGIQQATFKIGKATAHLTIEVIDKADYAKGNAAGLELVVGLTKAQATKYAGQWISITSDDKAYAPTSQAVTLPSLVPTLSPRGHLAQAAAKLHGQKVVAVRGTFGKGKKKTVEVLVAPATGKPLPLEFDVATPGMQSLVHTTFSKWNEAVSVTAPASSTPIATVRGS